MVYEIDALTLLKPCHMQVNDSGLQGLVAEPALHGLDVLAGLQQVSGIAVAERMRRERSGLSRNLVGINL